MAILLNLVKSCIGNDLEARQTCHNGENLQKGVYNVVCNSNYIIAQFLLYNCCIKIHDCTIPQPF